MHTSVRLATPHRSWTVILACVLTLLASCGVMRSRDLPPAPASSDVSDYSYIVGAGNNLNIIVWRNPELSMAVPVRPDGKVKAPLVNELVAQGKTPTPLVREIEKKLATYVRDPRGHGHRHRFRRPVQRANWRRGRGGPAAVSGLRTGFSNVLFLPMAPEHGPRRVCVGH